MTLETAQAWHPGPAIDADAPGAGAPGPAPLWLVRGALRFWCASLGGFALHGWFLARSWARGLAEAGPTGGLGEVVVAGLALGLLEAVVLGAPGALLFAAATGRAGRRAWPEAAAVAAALAAGLGVALAGWAWLAGDLGFGSVPAVHLGVALTAVAAGALVCALGGRGR